VSQDIFEKLVRAAALRQGLVYFPDLGDSGKPFKDMIKP
jgi:hypothetical protein